MYKRQVLIPFNDKVSVSQKIKSSEERARLKQLLQSIKPKNFGVIVRLSLIHISQHIIQIYKRLHQAKEDLYIEREKLTGRRFQNGCGMTEGLLLRSEEFLAENVCQMCIRDRYNI